MSPIRELHKVNSTWVPLFGGVPSDAQPDSFTLGETKPSAANTGLNVSGVAVGSLTVVPGNTIHTTDDAVYENIRFTGRVEVRGKRITYRNCWFNAPHTAPTAMVMCFVANCEAALFEHCLFKPSSFATTADTALGACIYGHDFTLYRCDLSGGIDLIDLYSGVALSTPAKNVNVLGSYMHDIAYFSPDAGHSDNQTHSDALQVHGGALDFVMRGTRIDAFLDPAVGQASDPPVTTDGQHMSGNKQYPSLAAMSCFMMTPANATARVTNFTIDRNWLGGGIVVVNWARSDGSGVNITNNRWTRGTYLGDDFTILMQSAQPATITGNYYEDTQTPYNERKNG